MFKKHGFFLHAKLILLMLIEEQPDYALNLVARYKDRTLLTCDLSYQELLTLLKDAEREGLLKTEETGPIPIRGNRPRVIYSVTADGKARAAFARDMLATLLGKKA